MEVRFGWFFRSRIFFIGFFSDLNIYTMICCNFPSHVAIMDERNVPVLMLLERSVKYFFAGMMKLSQMENRPMILIGG